MRWGAKSEYPRNQGSEKFYLKSVTPEEIAKIEYEDEVQNFARRFETNSYFDIKKHRLLNSGYNVLPK